MKDIISEFYKKVLSFFNAETKEENSKDTACNRLKLVLMQDRAKMEPALMEKMREEMIEVISKYVVIDKEALDLNLEAEGDSFALMLNIPVIRAKTREEIEEEEEEKGENENTDSEEASDDDKNEEEDSENDDDDNVDDDDDDNDDSDTVIDNNSDAQQQSEAEAGDDTSEKQAEPEILKTGEKPSEEKSSVKGLSKNEEIKPSQKPNIKNQKN